MGGALLAAPTACTHTIEITAPPDDRTAGPPDGGQPPDAAPPSDAQTPPGLDDDASALDWNGEWEWLTPDTSGHTFRAAWAAAPDDLWLVGDHGVVVRWDGKSRARVVYQGPNDVSLKAIAGRGPNDVWVAGTNHVAHWDGARWSYQSHWLGRLDIRTLLAVGDTSLVALTEDGRLFEKGAVLGTSSIDGVYDVTPAARGGAYALRAEGVEWLRYAANNRGIASREMVVSFEAPLDKNVWKHGRLFGNSPESFRYFFEYDASPGSWGTSFIVTETPPPRLVHGPSQGFYLKRAHPDERYRRLLVRRADSEHAFIQLGGSSTLVYDGRTLHHVGTQDYRVRGAFRTASGAMGLLGLGGLVAETRVDAQGGNVELVPLHTRASGPQPRIRRGLFAVASDDTAWAAGLRDPAEPRSGAFAHWDEQLGFVWRDTPARMRVIGLHPVAANDVWLLLGAQFEADPKPDLVAHWNGVRFDSIKPFERDVRLAMSAAEPGGTFFAVSNTGELFHADAAGDLVALGRASDDHGGPGCKVGSADGWSVVPMRDRRAYVVGPRCSITFFDGRGFRRLPPFETNRPYEEPGTIHLWARDERHVFVLQAFNGLYRWDGERWAVLYRTTDHVEGLWGGDDKHVWFVESPNSRFNFFDFDPRTSPGWRLKMWDGKAVRDVGTTPGASSLTGGSTTAWLFGYGTGGEAATLRLRATPRSPRPR